MINRSKRLLISGLIAFIGVVVFTLTIGATDGSRNPWNKVWQAIYDLQAKVESLNTLFTNLQSQVDSMNQEIQRIDQTLEALKTRVPKKGSFRSHSVHLYLLLTL